MEYAIGQNSTGYSRPVTNTPVVSAGTLDGTRLGVEWTIGRRSGRWNPLNRMQNASFQSINVESGTTVDRGGVGRPRRCADSDRSRHR